jgi:hypothetical protein
MRSIGQADQILDARAILVGAATEERSLQESYPGP